MLHARLFALEGAVYSFASSKKRSSDRIRRTQERKGDMNNKILTLVVALSFTMFGIIAKANPIAVRTHHVASVKTDSTVHQVLKRLDRATKDFRHSFETSLDRSRINGSEYEDFMNQVVATFEHSIENLKDQAGDPDDLNKVDLRTTFDNAGAINDFLARRNFGASTMLAWDTVKTDLNQLASTIGASWAWGVSTTGAWSYPQVPAGQRVGMINNMPLAREVRHALLSDLPYYNVFDWIEFRVQPDNTVVLNGQITTPPDTKSRAEAVVEDIPGVTGVVNQINVLPLSPNDDQLRHRLYNEIYGFNSPLFRYAIGSRQSIHIIVANGRATLNGVVDSEGDKQLAFLRAKSVPGLFVLNNELRVDGSRREIY